MQYYIVIISLGMAKRRASKHYLSRLRSKSFSKISFAVSDGKSVGDQMSGAAESEQEPKKKVSIADNRESKSDEKNRKSTEDRVKLPPLNDNLRRIKTGRKSASHQNLATAIVVEPEFVEASRTLTHSRASFIQTGTSYFNKDDEDDMNEEKGSKVSKSLPKIKLNITKKERKLRNSEISDMVLSQYEQLRGLPANEYATRCMSVANNFKQKPWLQQVRQAMIIATRGMNKTLSRQRNILHPVKAKPARLPPMQEENVG